ncbi:hypothetical protein RJT34_09860 [Clitoria ternatea]|uniref:GH16 domain-containing protein n=1 Tax=Clitoria ternatea TaxID=43366 RepID=A0AAN9K677_CLITE
MGVSMAKLEKVVVALLICAVAPNIIQVDADFSKSMYLTWGVQHASILGEDLHLVLDKTSRSAAQSKRSFLFGSIEMLIKPVPGNSAGTVTAYYGEETWHARNREMGTLVVLSNTEGTMEILDRAFRCRQGHGVLVTTNDDVEESGTIGSDRFQGRQSGGTGGVMG